MKALTRHIFDPVACRAELQQFDILLQKATLSESKDVLPFFKKSINLSLLICTYFPKIVAQDVYAHEYMIDGDFVADLVAGSFSGHQYVLVEFEDGTAESIFKRKGKKASRDWAARFESAYSQLVDWLWKLEDNRSTAVFPSRFGHRRAKFHCLIVIGKGMNLSAEEEDRLKWRMDRTMIDSNAISVVSFEQLRNDFDHWLTKLYGV